MNVRDWIKKNRKRCRCRHEQIATIFQQYILFVADSSRIASFLRSLCHRNWFHLPVTSILGKIQVKFSVFKSNYHVFLDMPRHSSLSLRPKTLFFWPKGQMCFFVNYLFDFWFSACECTELKIHLCWSYK